MTAVSVREADACRAAGVDLSRKVGCEGVCRCKGLKLAGYFLNNTCDKSFVGGGGHAKDKG